MQTSSFGVWVRARRRALGLTQDDLAKQVGCSTVTIRKIEADERRPSLQMAERLARFLEITIDQQAAFMRAARVEDEAPTARSTPSNLPARLPQLIGRDSLVQTARNRLLRDDTRALTLIGTAGVGKTSLALRLAADAIADFPDGVFFVDLAPVERAEYVLATVAEVLGALTPAQQPAAVRVRAHIGARRMLLLLDNMEHLVAAQPQLAALLADCMGLTLLITSRAALRMSGEQALEVPALPAPAPTEMLDAIALLRYPAAELFVQRARAVRHDFQATDSSAAAIGMICARLDGLPLAIELVAARSNVIEPLELARRLGGAHGYTPLQLGRGAAHLPARQRTLHGAIDWSFHLLGPREQRMLLLLGVFNGGFDLPDAEAVCAALDFAPIDVLEGLQQLIEAHLLNRQTTGEQIRFVLLQTIREYALAELTARGLAEIAYAAHARYFCALAIEAEAQMPGPDEQLWMARLDREHDNLRAALRWALQAALPLAGELGLNLWWFWLVAGHWREGMSWLNRVLERLDATPDLLPDLRRAALYKGVATLAKELADYTSAGQRYQQALAIYRAHDDTRGLATTLNNFAGMLHRQGHVEQATALYQESMGYVRALGLRAAEGLLLSNLGVLSQEQGRYAESRAYNEAGLAVLRELNDLRGMANCLINLGEFELLRGDLALAAERYREAQALYEACNDPSGRAHALNGLGLVAYREGAYARAIDLQQQALRLSKAVGDPINTIQIIEGCAHAAGALGLIVAASLYGTAEQQRAALTLPLTPIYRELYAAAQAQAARPHNQRSWAAMLLRGRAQALDMAVADALALPSA